MKKKLLTLLFLIVLFIVPTTLAASNQGLLWGIAEDQAITYNVDTEYVTLTSQNVTTIQEESYQLIVTVTDLPEIPADISEVYDLPIPTVSIAFGNGTEMTEAIPATNALFVLPAGNWSLMEEIFSDIVSRWYTDEPATWGYSINSDVGGIDIRNEIRYSRSDGTMFYQEIRLDVNQSLVDEPGDFEIVFERAGTNDILQWIANHPTLAVALIGGGVAVVVIIGIAIFKVKRR